METEIKTETMNDEMEGRIVEIAAAAENPTATAVIEFFRPDGWKILTFVAILLGFMIITSTLSVYGLFSYSNCMASQGVVLCTNEDFFMVGLPVFYVGEKKIATETVAPTFFPDVFAANLVIWYLVACGIIAAARAGGGGPEFE